MSRWIVGCLVLSLSVVPAVAQDDASAVVKKAITAHGGADALNKYKAGEYAGKGQMSVFGMDLDFTGTVVYQVPDKYRMVIATEVNGQKFEIVQIVSGKEIKSTVAGQPQKLGDAEKAELAQAAMLQEVSQLTPLLEGGKYTLKAEKDAKVGDEAASVVTVTAKDFKPTKLYFSKASGLLIKTERKGLAPTMGEPKEVNEETVLSDHKKVEGVVVPMKMTVTHDGKKFLGMTMSSAKVMEKADPKAFE